MPEEQNVQNQSPGQAGFTALPLETVASAPQLGPEAILHSFHTQHFVREAPRIGQIPDDETRNNTFHYYPTSSMTRRQRFAGGEIGDPVAMTEHEGLIGLRVFLKETADDIHAHGGNSELEGAIDTIATRTSFIGERELQEATSGIAELWKEHL